MALVGLESEVEEAEQKAKYIDVGTRELAGALRTGVNAVALVFGLGEFVVSLGLIQLDTAVERPVHLAFAFTLCFALYPMRQKTRGPRLPLWDWLLIAVALVVMSYVVTVTERLVVVGPGGASQVEVVLGIIAALVVLEGARRAVGPAIPLLALVLLAYAAFGDLVPGTWGHRPFSIGFLSSSVYFSDRGIFGSITGLSAGVIAAFLIFGAVLHRTGGGEAFVGLARLLAGRSHGGPAKVSGVSSALFGTVSGSAVANVIVDGTFNIPLMKRSGYKPEFASAVEAVASTGGQIVPPVMGVAAFVMAEFVGRPYSDVAFAAVIPAFLYYAGVMSAIHFEALRHRRPTVPESLIPRPGAVLRQVGSIAVPVAALVALMTAGYTAVFSVAASTVVAIVTFLVAARGYEELRRRAREATLGFIDGAKGIVMIAVLVSCAEIVVLVVDLTGLGVKFSQLITSAASASMLLALVAGMLTTLVLGMGVPTTAAYVIGAAVVIPALGQLGVVPMAAHMFVFYFAVIAAVTPPFAPAIYASSAIAGGDWVKAGIIAVRLALGSFLVPFLLVYSPALVLEADAGTIVWRTVLSLFGVISISAGVWGYLRRSAGILERVVLVVAGMLLVSPGWETDAAGIALGLAVFAYQSVVPVGFLSSKPAESS